MRIINVMKEPYEFTFDGGHYGPILSGQVVDYPDEVALHAVKRSVVLDEVGDIVGYRVKPLHDMTKEQLREMAVLSCPLTSLGQCDVKPFKSYADLMKHMESHNDATDGKIRKQ